MFGKVKKVFFTGVFGLLYISFIAQAVYLFTLDYGWDVIMLGLAALSFEWLVLISARYLSKRSSGAAQFNGYNRRH